MSQLKLHPEARKELDAARRYYRARHPEVAQRFAREVLDVLLRIAEAPGQFPKDGLLPVTIGSGSTLFFDVYRAVLPKTFPYVIFFFVRSDVAVVLAVAHAKRRPGYWSVRAK